MIKGEREKLVSQEKITRAWLVQPRKVKVERGYNCSLFHQGSKHQGGDLRNLR